MSRKFTPTRIKITYQRQRDPQWDETYQPSILATPQEAPSKSRPSILRYGEFNRDIHLLSSAELLLCLLGLYNPDVIGIQEQRMLSLIPTQHPLYNFPGVDRLRYSTIQGTIQVAERLGVEKFIPKLTITKSGKKSEVAIPFIRDILWAVKNGESIGCINWSIKSQVKQFAQIDYYQFDRFSRDPKAYERLLARHEIERTLYEDAGIRTVFIAEEQVDRNVLSNLRQLILYHRRCLHLLPNQRAELFHHFQTAFQTDIPPTEIIRKFDLRGKFTPEESKSVLFQAIWHRQLRADLFQPILIDRPIRSESKDALEVYANFFKGGL